MNPTKLEKEMITFALRVVLKNYCSTQEEEQRYKDLITHIEEEDK
jgi:hypothetical protein